MYGAVELGGTKIICGISESSTEFIDTVRIETRDPHFTVAGIIDFFNQSEFKFGPLKGLGLASFGPIDLNVSSSTYGSILKTPKPGWSDFPLMEKMTDAFEIPIGLTTDVNAALLAEHELGAAKDVQNAIYVTVGTGIGAGIMANGELVNGFMHPEIGHMRIPHDSVEGICSFHGNCLEGLAAGPAIAARAGKSADQLPEDHPVWDSVASNLADMCNNLLLTTATERIVLGGGVMARADLIAKIKQKLDEKLNGYLALDQVAHGLDRLIVPASVHNGPGLVGALLLAHRIVSQAP